MSPHGLACIPAGDIKLIVQLSSYCILMYSAIFPPHFK